MGPAQFIPSTWVGYQDRISKLAGHPGTQANPWDNLDAFTAIALYMTDLGADAQTPSAERTAALKYFAGGYYTNPRFAPYGDSVMQFASDFQQEINILNGS
jgi:membrane-bound lytic murein transglycosylase B